MAAPLRLNTVGVFLIEIAQAPSVLFVRLGLFLSTARLMIGIEQSDFELIQENDSFFFERDFFMIL